MGDPIDLNEKLYTASILLDKRDKIHNVIHTFGSLESNFGLSMRNILNLVQEKIIAINYCYLMAEYVHMYKKQKPQLMRVGNDRILNSIIYYPDGLPEGLKEYCGLPKKVYNELLKTGKAAVDILDYADTVNYEFSPLKFMNFKIDLDRKKVIAFIQKNTFDSAAPTSDQEVPIPHQPIYNQYESAEVYYNKQTGVGYVNGKRFKLKNNQPDFFVFAELYYHFGRTLDRKQVLILSKREEAQKDITTYFINDLAKKIRERTGLDIDSLVLNNGCLTLVGIKLKKPPKVTPNHP